MWPAEREIVTTRVPPQMLASFEPGGTNDTAAFAALLTAASATVSTAQGSAVSLPQGVTALASSSRC